MSCVSCAGLATRDNMFDGLALGTMGGTYGAAPLACATANATLDVIMEENLLENSTQRGRQLVEVRLYLLVTFSHCSAQLTTAFSWPPLDVIKESLLKNSSQLAASSWM